MSQEQCRTVLVVAFRGDRSAQAEARFQDQMDNEEHHGGPAPSRVQCLLHAGHAGLSLDGGRQFFGFNPHNPGLSTRELFNRLAGGECLPGLVLDDTSVFQAADQVNLPIAVMEVHLPSNRHAQLDLTVKSETPSSRFTYGFPYGLGDCNCITWMERIGLPLVSGQMKELMGAFAAAGSLSRRFGNCRI